MLHFFAQESLNIKILCKVTQTGLSQGWLLYHWNCIFFIKWADWTNVLIFLKRKLCLPSLKFTLLLYHVKLHIIYIYFVVGDARWKLFFLQKTIKKETIMFLLGIYLVWERFNLKLSFFIDKTLTNLQNINLMSRNDSLLSSFGSRLIHTSKITGIISV